MGKALEEGLRDLFPASFPLHSAAGRPWSRFERFALLGGHSETRIRFAQVALQCHLDLQSVEDRPASWNHTGAAGGGTASEADPDDHVGHLGRARMVEAPSRRFRTLARRLRPPESSSFRAEPVNGPGLKS